MFCNKAFSVAIFCVMCRSLSFILVNIVNVALIKNITFPFSMALLTVIQPTKARI